FQKSMFRAGHAHAGVLVILALVAQLFADHASLSNRWKWFARLSFPISAITISLGFFAAAIGRQITEPTGLIFILSVGIAILTFGLLTLGIGLIRQKKHRKQLKSRLMKNILSPEKILQLIAFNLTLVSCTHGFQQNKLHTDTEQTTLQSDTLIVDKWAAVFVEPDSLRIEKRKKEIGEEDFHIIADDYLFYMYKSYEFLDSIKLTIITTKGEKFIKF